MRPANRKSAYPDCRPPYFRLDTRSRPSPHPNSAIITKNKSALTTASNCSEPAANNVHAATDEANHSDTKADDQSF
jgi:hypothetical protein